MESFGFGPARLAIYNNIKPFPNSTGDRVPARVYEKRWLN